MTAIPAMLNIKEPSAITYDAIGTSLKAVAEFGSSKLMMEISSLFADPQTVRQITINLKNLHHKVVSRYEYDVEDLPKVDVITASTFVPKLNATIPLCSFCFNSAKRDSTHFKQFAQEDLPLLKQQFPNLDTIFMPLDGVCAEVTQAANALGIRILSHFPNSNKTVRPAVEQVKANNALLKPFNVKDSADPEQKTQVKMVFADDIILKSKEHKLSVPYKLLVLVDESMREKKTNSLTQKAQTEQDQLTTELKKLNRQHLTSLEEAQKQFAQATAKLTWCKVSEPQYVEHQPKAKAAKTAKADTTSTTTASTFTIKAKVTIDEQAIQSKIDNDLLYTILSSDLSLSEVELYELYQDTKNIEELKIPEFFVPDSYLDFPQLVSSLMAIVTLSVIVLQSVLGIAKSISEAQSNKDAAKNSKTSKPDLELLVCAFKRFAPIKLVLNPQGTCDISQELAIGFIYNLIMGIGVHLKVADILRWRTYALAHVI